MAILVSIALGVLLDILIDVMISRPRHECSIRRRGLGPLPRHFVGGNWHGHKESVGFQSRAGELSHVRFSDAASATTEVLEAIALGWLDLREVWLRNGQMGSSDYANTRLSLPLSARPSEYSLTPRNMPG